jgi:hypothetical protein
VFQNVWESAQAVHSLWTYFLLPCKVIINLKYLEVRSRIFRFPLTSCLLSSVSAVCSGYSFASRI